MEANNIPHGPIEALITTTEESGMHGARGLKEKMLNGDILINLDSESEGELFVGVPEDWTPRSLSPITKKRFRRNTLHTA